VLRPDLLAAGSSSAAQHGYHFAAAAVFLVAGLGAAALADARQNRGDSKPRAARRATARFAMPLVVLCALATVSAATVHVYVIPEHFEESALYGAFFVTLAVVQLAWAAWVSVRPSRRLLASGIAANAGVVMLWAASRFIAVPLGPGAGTREAIGGLDVFATSCELVVIVTAALLLRGVGTRMAHTLKRNSVTSPSAIT
jgi:hypothetical protein